MSKKTDILMKVLGAAAAVISVVFSSKDAKDQIKDLKETLKQK